MEPLEGARACARSRGEAAGLTASGAATTRVALCSIECGKDFAWAA